VNILNGDIVSTVRLIRGWNRKKTLLTSPIIRESEQVEIPYAFDKALVFTVLRLDAYAQKEHGCGSSVKTIPFEACEYRH
jgi:hypothetical protein